MSAEFWVMFIILTAVVAATGGYAAARRGAPKRSELEALKRELDAAHKHSDDVQSNVTSHFEQSAVLFGQLARDYRAFLQHFSESARDLGISEARARELLERADRPLLAKSSEIIDAETDAADTSGVADASGYAAATRTAAETRAAAATAAAAAPEAAAPDADASESAPAPVAAENTKATADTPASASLAETAALDAAAPAPAADSADVPEATEGVATPEPEPPLIDDVVKPGRPARSADADAGTVASRVVDVDLDALGLPVPEEEQPGSDGASAGDEPSRKHADGA